MTPSVRMIVELNIEHYRARLATERHPDKRAVIERLLAEEEGKLLVLTKRDEG